MGIGLTVLGIVLSIFNIQIGFQQIFPKSIACTIIILGLLYCFKNLNKKRYLFYAGYFFLSMLILFFNFTAEWVKPINEILNYVVYYFLFSAFAKEEHHYQNIKQYLHILKIIKVVTLIYFINMVSFLLCSNQGMIELNDVFGTIVMFSKIVLIFLLLIQCYHLYHINKLIDSSKVNEIKSFKGRKLVAILIIIICSSLLFLIQQPFFFTVNNQYVTLASFKIVSNNFQIYIIDDQRIEEFKIPFGATESTTWYSNRALIFSDIVLENQVISIEQSGDTILSGVVIKEENNQFAINAEYQFIYIVDIQYLDLDIITTTSTYATSQYTDADGSQRMITAGYQVSIGEEDYQVEFTNINFDEYSYKDFSTIIDHCFIEDGYLLSLPRIQLGYSSSYKIISLTILDNQKNSLFIEESNFYSRKAIKLDMYDIYNEELTVSPIYVGKGPYSIQLEMMNENNEVITKEYVLSKQ